MRQGQVQTRVGGKDPSVEVQADRVSWSFSEVEEPTYNIPVSLLIKEVATKINRMAFGVQASSEEVGRILASIQADPSEMVYLRVFELGYTSNPEAIPHLVEIARTHRVSLARATASSTLP